MKQICSSIIILCIACVLYGGCSKSGRKVVTTKPSPESTGNKIPAKIPESTQPKTIVKMKKANGVYEIPTEINGVPMHFIFDTGAGLISISQSEINLLKDQGKFSDEDITGKGEFMDANGDITEGTIVVLKTVKIGDRLLTNIEAAVVSNLKAPLLMGQSALENFGKISIDYKKEEITFE